MTWEEATQLGSDIRRGYPRLELMAVGRFKTREELFTEPEKWGVSVLIDRQTQRVLWSRDEAMAFSSQTTKTARSRANAKPVVEDAGAPMLF